MTNPNFAVDALMQGTVVDQDGDNVGKVGQVYLDNNTSQPNWVTVKTGWFGTNESFVPLDAATVEGDTIRVPYSKDQIKGAPNYEVGAPLDESDEANLYSYYGLNGTSGTYDTYAGDTAGVVDTGTVSGTAGGTGDYLTRSEEQLQVGTEKVQTGRARLRKYVVTEEQNVTVPVSHEEVRVVREPVAAGEQVSDATIGEAATDAVLTEERVVVQKETVPVEKVGLETETVTENQQVSESVRKEQIAVEDGTTADRSRMQ